MCVDSAASRRQSLLFSSLSLPLLNSLMRRFENVSGVVRLSNTFAGVLSRVQLPVRQLFRRLNTSASSSPGDIVEERFRVFTKEILPRLTASTSSHILIFVPSYFDYVRLRNYMNKYV
jgi:U3 small nucleolar RNA-associated protein 25